MLTGKNILLGYSGHAYVVADAAFETGIQIHYYADKNRVKNNPFDLEYIGYEKDEQFNGWKLDCSFILGIGDNMIRENTAHLIRDNNKELITITHPRAFVSRFSTIGNGTFIAAHSCVNAYAQIGNYVILNTSSVVEHECIIADSVHIAPGAILAGNVRIGTRTFIGANAVIREGVSIGNDVIIGAGSTIISDISDGKKVVGNPGREI